MGSVGRSFVRWSVGRSLGRSVAGGGGEMFKKIGVKKIPAALRNFLRSDVPSWLPAFCGQAAPHSVGQFAHALFSS